MKGMRVSLLMGVATLALANLPARAATVDDVIKAGVLRVCTPGDYRPFSFALPDGTFEGLDVDLMQSLTASLGVKAEFVKTTWANLLPDFVARKCDIAVGGISVTLERQKQVSFSTAYMVNGKTPLVRCADVKRFQTVADIDKPDVRVVANPGGSNENYARTALTQAKLTMHPENLTIFQELIDKRADVFVTEAAEAIVKTHEHKGVLCGVNPDKPLRPAQNGWLVQNQDFRFKAYVDQFLRLEKMSGNLDSVIGRWLPR